MTQIDNPHTAKPLTGRSVFLSLLAFFGVVIAVNGAMTALAISTMPGTEVENPYRAGIAYNTEISAAHDQAGRQLRVSGHIDRDASGHASVNIEARDRTSAPLAGLAVTVRFMRPTDQRADRTVTLTEPQTGSYRGEAVDVSAGAWDVEIEAARGGERVFRSRNRVVLE
jgi:nitrogen fixation protein FixH